MGHVVYTPVYASQYDICLFHNSVTVLTYIWLMLRHVFQMRSYRTSIKDFFSPSRTPAASHICPSETLVALPIKLHLISFKLRINFDEGYFLF